jgi:hypothetical protein
MKIDSYTKGILTVIALTLTLGVAIVMQMPDRWTSRDKRRGRQVGDVSPDRQ